MEKVLTLKDANTPEEYLKNMLDCIDENGELSIAREIDDVTFCTANTVDEATHIEKVKLDRSLADYDALYDCYKEVLSVLCDGSFKSDCRYTESVDKYYDRVITFANRIERLVELEAPEVILQNERRMLVDSIVLYKTNAVGDLVKING